MFAPARRVQARRSVSSSAWSQPASRRQSARSTARGLGRRASRPASLGCRGLESRACDCKRRPPQRASVVTALIAKLERLPEGGLFETNGHRGCKNNSGNSPFSRVVQKRTTYSTKLARPGTHKGARSARTGVRSVVRSVVRSIVRCVAWQRVVGSVAHEDLLAGCDRAQRLDPHGERERGRRRGALDGGAAVGVAPCLHKLRVARAARPSAVVGVPRLVTGARGVNVHRDAFERKEVVRRAGAGAAGLGQATVAHDALARHKRPRREQPAAAAARPSL
eukprot:scaffold89832_cov60-Phaeocystis_antarctica.AAC.3